MRGEPTNRAQFDRDYVERLKNGDTETERHFTRYFGDLVTAKLRARWRCLAAPDDVRQETLLRVLVALKEKNRLATPEALGAFVNSVCNNVVFETYRRQSADAAPPSEPEDEVREDRPDAESVLLSQEAGVHVREALAGLPSSDKALLNLLFLEERDKDDVCRRLGITRSHLRVRLHRAKARFRGAFLRRTTGIPFSPLARANAF